MFSKEKIFQKEGETESQGDSAPSAELDAGLDL